MTSSGAATVAQTRQVRLFRNGRNQAVRIPREFELPGREATLRKVGDRLILEPVRRKSLLQVLATMTPLAPGDEFPDVDETLAPPDEDPSGTGATSARR
ncbi:MAG: AbrB/MazE/SpoVT family DNA-binding domain-containing protein [Gammaproteobacteria bacterium]|nr:AbrB/MazE/SpoVT family DNA-binding domain-containing protein [Gammaproteobacteria bacterium]